MGAENDMDRYAASLRLSKEAMSRRNKVLADKTNELDFLTLKSASPRKSPVYVDEDVVRTVKDGAEVTMEMEYKTIVAPYSKKEPVGEVRFVSEGEEIARAKVYVKEDIKKPNPVLSFRDIMADVFRAMEKAA